MSQALQQVLPTFAADFARGLATNLWLAAGALAQGLPVGMALGALRLPPEDARDGPGRPRAWRRACARAAGALTGVMRATPAFVLMYVLLEMAPGGYALTAPDAVRAALSVYAATYASDNLLVLLRERRAGEHGGAPLFVTGVVRAYFVMVLSSGFGAAVGVTEGVTATLRAMESLPTTADRLWLMGGVVGVFVAVRQLVQAATAGLQALLRRGCAHWRPARQDVRAESK